MEILKIKALADEWNAAAWKVIEFENPGFQALRKLFEETLELVEEYNKNQLVPKEISGVLLEMHDFGWWVGDLVDTPLHSHYQEIVAVVNALNKHFLSGASASEDIKAAIEKIAE